MINDIKELNFPPYATLQTATATMQDMGESTITSQVKIDGRIRPDFSFAWEVEFKGERYIHPIRKPQATKENTSLSSVIDLTFQHWAVYELKRYYFVEMAPIESGTAVVNKYISSMSLNLGDFIDAFNKVLDYYYGGRIKADLNPEWKFDEEKVFVEISNSYIWDVLLEIYDVYKVRWTIETEGDICVIKFGYNTTELSHVFEYGFQGGLLKVERQVQSDNIRNIILGRGGEKNLPYRYFKNVDPQNPLFPADPDWIPELKDMFFSELRESAFRSYVQGWKARHYADADMENSQIVQRDDATVAWAWDMGYNDEKFNPVEFVKDDDSIEKYGELWGALDNNDDIFPTIQGVTIDGIGRVDEVVDVEQIESDDIETEDVQTKYTSLKTYRVSWSVYRLETKTTKTDPIPFTVEKGMKANIISGGVDYSAFRTVEKTVLGDVFKYNTIKEAVDCTENVPVTLKEIRVYKPEDYGTFGSDKYISSVGIPEGDWVYVAYFEAINTLDEDVGVSACMRSADLQQSTVVDDESSKWKNVFNIWVKNIWSSEKLETESDEEYVSRVWSPILGNHLGDDAKVVFSTGLLSISQDYEFLMPSPLGKCIHYDTSKELNGVRSEWRITLKKSDADLETLGVYVPNTKANAVAGDKFFFIGIDLPYMYYTEAEKRLTAYKYDALKEVSDIKPTWVVNLDKVRIAKAQNGEVETLLEQIKAGASIKLADERFIKDYFTEYENLYIQSITYNYKEPQKDSPSIIPDVDIVLSDSYQVTSNPVETIQGQIDNIQNIVSGLSATQQTIKNVGDIRYLRKDGGDDVTYTETDFKAPVRVSNNATFAETTSSDDFSQGTTDGKGWGLYKNLSKWIMETDMLSIRDRILGILRIGETNDRNSLFPDGTDILDSDMLLKVGGNARIDKLLLALAGIYTNLIKSDDFNGDGVLDSGFRLTKDDGTGHSYMVVDKLYVRLKAIFNELEIRKISYAGGNIIFSHAGGQIALVSDIGDAYRCYLMADDGTTRTENWWRVDDQARCQTFNIEAGVHENVENKYYWRMVVGVGSEETTDGIVYDYVDLSKEDCEKGSDVPAAGDTIVQMGNRTDAERQGFISLEVSGEYAPALKVYKGVNSYSVEKNRKICISPKMTEIRAQRFVIETEYDAQPVPLERGEWESGRGYYYYDLVQHNDSTWLCIYPEGGIGGVMYTTEEPSETATYWTVYAKGGKGDKGDKGDSGADAVNVVLSPEYVILSQSMDGNMGIDLSNAGTEVSFIQGDEDVSQGMKVSATGHNCNVGNISINRVTGHHHVPISAILTKDGKYYDSGWVDITVTYGGKEYTKRFMFYCNLLGTWKQTIVGDTMTAVAEKLQFVDAGGEKVGINNIAEYLQSASENVSTLTKTVNGYTKSISEIKQTADEVSLSVNSGYKNYILDSFGIDGKDTGSAPILASKFIDDNDSVTIVRIGGGGDFQLAWDMDEAYKELTNQYVTLYAIVRNNTAYEEDQLLFGPWHTSTNRYHDALYIRYDEEYGTVTVDTHEADSRYTRGGKTKVSVVHLYDDWYRCAFTFIPKTDIWDGESGVGINSVVGVWDVYAVGIIKGEACPTLNAIITNTGLLRTGIDILKDTIRMRADRTEFLTSKGVPMITVSMTDAAGNVTPDGTIPSLVFYNNDPSLGGQVQWVMNYLLGLKMVNASSPAGFTPNYDVFSFKEFSSLLTKYQHQGLTEDSSFLATDIAKRHFGGESPIIEVTYRFNASFYVDGTGRKVYTPANGLEYECENGMADLVRWWLTDAIDGNVFLPDGTTNANVRGYYYELSDTGYPQDAYYPGNSDYIQIESRQPSDFALADRVIARVFNLVCFSETGVKTTYRNAFVVFCKIGYTTQYQNSAYLKAATGRIWDDDLLTSAENNISISDIISYIKV